MSDPTETTESFPTLPASENVAESGLIANAELAAGLEAEPTAVPESAEGMWAAIRESLRGSHRDYTVGPIGRAVILLAIPMVLEMFMESLFAVADIFWVSHLGPEAAATVEPDPINGSSTKSPTSVNRLMNQDGRDTGNAAL